MLPFICALFQYFLQEERIWIQYQIRLSLLYGKKCNNNSGVFLILKENARPQKLHIERGHDSGSNIQPHSSMPFPVMSLWQ